MKYFTFCKENNDFSDILNDPAIKKVIDLKIMWYQHLIIGIQEYKNERTFSYITIKHGDEMVTELIKDFSPIAGIDYHPKKDVKQFQKSIE